MATTKRKTRKGTPATLRAILSRATDPDHPEYIQQSTIADCAEAWAEVYAEACAAIGVTPSAAAQELLRDSILAATPFGLKDAVIDGFKAAMLQDGVVWAGLSKPACKAHGSYRWADAMADEIAVLGGLQGGLL